MRSVKISIVVAALIIAVAFIVNDTVELRFDNTTVCVPEEFVPGPSLFGLYLYWFVEGLDESGQEQIIRLPAAVIKQGVENYTLRHVRYSEVTKQYFDYEHKINGIAMNRSNVGSPDSEIEICNEEQEYCYLDATYKGIYFSFTLHTSEMHLKNEIRAHLSALFEQWERQCNDHA